MKSIIHQHQNNKFDDLEEAAGCAQIKVRIYGHVDDSVANSNPDKHMGMLDIEVSTKRWSLISYWNPIILDITYSLSLSSVVSGQWTCSQ